MSSASTHGTSSSSPSPIPSTPITNGLELETKLREGEEEEQQHQQQAPDPAVRVRPDTSSSPRCRLQLTGPSATEATLDVQQLIDQELKAFDSSTPSPSSMGSGLCQSSSSRPPSPSTSSPSAELQATGRYQAKYTDPDAFLQMPINQEVSSFTPAAPSPSMPSSEGLPGAVPAAVDAHRDSLRSEEQNS